MKIVTTAILIIAALTLAACGVASAKVPTSKAEQLGKTLTCMGAPKAASADGLVSKWTGKWFKTPLDVEYKPNTGQRMPNPYPNEKAIFTITSGNMQKYAEYLTPGQQALFHTYPDYRMNIYSSHADFKYPGWFCKNNRYNATHATISNEQYGSVKGAHMGGIPFPIPQTGIQAISSLNWFVGAGKVKSDVDNIEVLADGSRVFGSGKQWTVRANSLPENYGKPYPRKGVMMYSFGFTLAPLRGKGTISNSARPFDFHTTETITWHYNPGTRRIAQMPVYAFDTPLPTTNGTVTIDEIGGFNGSPERYKWKLKGTRIIFVPANDYKILQTDVSYDKLLTKHYSDPKYLRWEARRVYVVVGTLRPHYRHIYPKRVLFINCNTFRVATADYYDHDGSLWRTGEIMSAFSYYTGLPNNFMPNFYMDLKDHSYTALNLSNERPYQTLMGKVTGLKKSMFTPDHLQIMGNS